MMILGRRKSAIAAFIVFILVLGIGIYRATRAEVSASDPQRYLTVEVDTKFKVYTAEGEELQMTLFQQALYAGGQEITTGEPSISYTAGGREIDWATFNISIRMTMTIKSFLGDQFDQSLVEEKVLVEKTLHEKTGNVSKAIDFKAEITPYAAQLKNGTTVVFVVRFFIDAAALDVYGVLRIPKPIVISRSLSTTWVEPVLEISTGEPEPVPATELAYQEGYRRGYDDGFDAGYQDGLAGKPMSSYPPSIPSSPYTDPILDQAWKEGYEIGYIDGYRAGYNAASYPVPPPGPYPIPMAAYSPALEIALSEWIVIYFAIAATASVAVWYAAKRFLGW